MSTTKTFSRYAFLFSLAAAMQDYLAAQGSSIENEKSRAYFRSIIEYGKIPPWKDGEYKIAANAVSDSIVLLANSFFDISSANYTFQYPLAETSETTDFRDLLVYNGSPHPIGIYIDKYPHAKLNSPRIIALQDKRYNLLDIGSVWVGNEHISPDYINALRKVLLFIEKNAGKKWKELFISDEDKYEQLYFPILKAVSTEISNICSTSEAASSFVKSAFGEFDYFLINLNAKSNSAHISAYELNNTLGFGKDYDATLLPQYLISAGFKESSNSVANTIISFKFNNEWIINLRLKLAGQIVRPEGIHFEIDFKGSAPHNLLQREIKW